MGSRPAPDLFEIEQMKIMAANGLTWHQIAKKTGRHPTTVKKTLESPEVKFQLAKMKADMADLFEDLSRRFLQSITQVDVEKINAYQRTVAAGICIDKSRLIKGDPTEHKRVSVVQAIFDLHQADPQRAREVIEALRPGKVEQEPKRVAARTEAVDPQE